MICNLPCISELDYKPYEGFFKISINARDRECFTMASLTLTAVKLETLNKNIIMSSFKSSGDIQSHLAGYLPNQNMSRGSNIYRPLRH